VRRAERVGIIGIDADGIRDPVEVPEERCLQNRVQDAGAVESARTRPLEIGAGQRPRAFRHVDCQTQQRPDDRVGVPVCHSTWIGNHCPRQRIITTSGTQKLCVSGRSIKALIEARGRRRDQLTLPPGERA